MKRVLKVLNVFLILLLVVGCATTPQSVTQKLAGEYVNYADGKKQYVVNLEKPKSEEDTSGNATVKIQGSPVCYGTYTVYENSKIVVVEYTNEFDGDNSNKTMSMDFDLEENTLTLTGYNSLIFKKK